MTMGFNQLGLVAGPIIGGAITSFSNWRWCFYVNLPVGAVAVVAIILLRIPQQTVKPPAISAVLQLPHYLDFIGFILFAPAVLQLLLALQYGGNQFPWNSSRVIGLFCGSAANFVVWFFWNWHKGEKALLPHAMIGRTAVWASGIYQGLLMSAVYGGIYFLPIYFQAINAASPMLSGVYLLPTILPQLVMAASSGLIITKMGYVIPLALFSTIFLSTASGLYSLLQPGSPTGEWVGFQIIGGIGSGAGLQVAVNAIQAVTTGEELSSAMAFMVFAQSLGPAIALALYNVIFDASLKMQLAERAPNVDAQAIVDAGATGFHSLVQPTDLNPVLKAYANSIDRVFFLVAALAACCGIFAWGMGWRDIRKKTGPQDNNEVVEIASDFRGVPRGWYGFPPKAAAVGNHEALVEHLIKRNVDASQKNDEYGAVIAAAAARSSLEIWRLWLRAGVDISGKDLKGMTALHHVAGRGDVTIMEELLHSGADINTRSQFRTTPLVLACYSKGCSALHLSLPDEDIACDLIYAEIPTKAIAADGTTPLLAALTMCSGMKTISLLIQKSTNAPIANQCGRTPLHQAAARASTDAVRLLLEAGVDIVATDRRGFAAARIALAYGKPATLKLILEGFKNAMCNTESMKPSKSS
ncbi:MFS multidrug transporter [Seiridium cupressi]